VWLAWWVAASADELMFAHLAWYGTLLGLHGLRMLPTRSASQRRSRLAYPVQDAMIFLFTLALGAWVADRVLERAVFNGDEVAYGFQANVYAHLRAWAPMPPCYSMFENYWILPYQGRRFSQYTPGWPLFMALFERMHAVWLAGPAMGGILAVGIARLARRLAAGLGGSYESAERIVAVAGPLAGFFAMLGPSLLLNAASRFSHTMVAACFAWAVESAAEVATPGLARYRGVGFGFLLGAATSLGLATRPSDGGFLGVGVFLYFAQALVRGRVRLPAFLGTCLGFGCFGGLTLVILRLQVGTWFATGYSVTPLFHPEGQLVLTFPTPSELKFGIPIATGSYCWWPVAPALAAVGLVRALGGRARGVSFMLAVSSLCLVGFYSFVQFGRGGDDGLGPRYVMPIVVAQAAGTGACLAPLLARLLDAVKSSELGRLLRVGEYGPGILMLASAAYGCVKIAPRTYPVEYAERHAATAPLRAARDLHLKNAVVMLVPGATVGEWWNLAQNPPLDPDPDVLFLTRKTAADEICARRHFPGRTWYRAGMSEMLTLLSAGPR
jgi:hypothetical protein